jgi:hypothetical protein
MSTTTTTKTTVPAGLDGRVLSRILEEGYGPGAWHGSDLKAAIADVPAALAFWRPGLDRHNIAEIVLHHAWCVRAVRSQLSAAPPEPFLREGEDWFEVSEGSSLGWPAIVAALDEQHSWLGTLVAEIAAGRATSKASESERFDLALGITCHAIYHAGQVQLIKRLRVD